MASTLSTARAPRTSIPLTEFWLVAYVREIGKVPLLSAHEEKELAYRAQGGDYAARDHLVRANLRLVVHLARAFMGPGLSLQDLVAEGNLGLLRAVESFDPAMDTRFSTYASYWIKHAVRRAVYTWGRPIRLPSYMNALIVQWRRATLELREKIGRAPIDDEVAGLLKLSKDKARLIRKAMRAQGAAFRPQGDEDEVSLPEQIPDHRTSTPESILVEAEQLQRALAYLQQLGPREASVLRMRFGLEGYDPMTLMAIGVRLGVTPERVRQIERAALTHLRKIMQV